MRLKIVVLEISEKFRTFLCTFFNYFKYNGISYLNITRHIYRLLPSPDVRRTILLRRKIIQRLFS